VAQQLGWPVLHSDEIRKELAGVDATTRMPSGLDEGIYAGEWSRRTYDALCSRARDLLERGRSVVLDASWSETARRGEAIRVAAETSSDLLAFRCDAPVDVAIARAASRASRGGDASDAEGQIVRHIAARFDPWPEARVIDTTASTETSVARVVADLGQR
jgi:predicted kinase